MTATAGASPASQRRGRRTNACKPSTTSEMAKIAPKRSRSVDGRIREGCNCPNARSPRAGAPV